MLIFFFCWWVYFLNAATAALPHNNNKRRRVPPNPTVIESDEDGENSKVRMWEDGFGRHCMVSKLLKLIPELHVFYVEFVHVVSFYFIIAIVIFVHTV